MGRGGSNPPSDTNRTYTPEVRFHQHSSLARLVRKAEPETVVEIGLPLRVSATQNADEIPQALDHRPDVVLGERGHWTTSPEFLLRVLRSVWTSVIQLVTTAASVPASSASR
jgi:hypothetical protein